LIAFILALLLGPGLDDVVRVGGSVPKPARITYEDPTKMVAGYTPIGIAILDITLDESGQPTDVSFVRGGGFKNEIDVEKVKAWRYQPTVVDGRPVKVTFRELIESFPDREVRSAFYAHAIQDRKESKGYRLFALDQLKTPEDRTSEVTKALRKLASDPDPDIRAAAEKLLKSAP
jgi:hypothetical protein